MKLSKKDIGSIGEGKASDFLIGKGYNVIEKNFRCNIGEIDLIVSKKNDELIFVEVRTRTNDFFGEPYETVNKKKQTKLYKLAEYYLSMKNINNRNCRFDIVSVLIYPDGEIKNLDHLENAFGM